MLKRIRVGVAIILWAVITFYFLDFAGVFPSWFPNLARVQFVPALLAGSAVVLAVLFLATWIFGRIYCSVICPMGIFQDIFSWMSRKFSHGKPYCFSREKKVLRYSVLAGVILSFLLGGTVVLGILDPYSAFGRMTVNVFRPVYMEGNNLLAAIFNRFDDYTFYHTDIFVLSGFSLLIGLLTFIGLAFLAYRYGRTYCNTVCPVGTLLGTISRYALLKIRIDTTACVSCGLCERKCKASCINSKERKVDTSRCVNCFNCLEACHKKAIVYSWRKRRVVVSPAKTVDVSKRRFVSTLALTALAVPQTVAGPVNALAEGKAYRKEHPLCPPGAISAAHLQKHCTACHLCVTKCPSRVLKPAFMEYGWEGMMQPRMDFEHGFCNFDCTVCSEICPNGALLPLTKEEKHRLQMGQVVFVKENCIVYREETSCGACSEHCPTQAVSMVAYKNGLTIPAVNPEICVGCGGCEYVCPVRPFRAIYIEGNSVQQQAKAFKEAEKKEVQLDDFGF